MSVDAQSRRFPRQFLPVAVVTATVESIALAARETAGVMIALDSGTIVDGTHTPKLQDSPDAVIWTDVPPFELQGAFSVIQADAIQKVGYRGRQPFIRLVVTVAGATLGGVYGAYLDRAKPGIIGEYDLSTINVLQGPEFLVAPNAREWDGDSFNKHEGVISNVVDGRLGTLSFWFKKAAGDQGHVFQMGPLFDILMGDQEIFVRVFQTGGGSQQVVVDTGLTGWAPDVWNHYMVSWENTFPAAAANVTQYLNGVELINAVNGVTGFAGGLDVDLGYAGSDMWEGTGTFELDNLEVCLSEFYLNLEERFDLTDADNRAQFRSPAGDAVNIGGDGSGPTGTQPAFYAANGELNPNAGTSDSLSTVTGKILNCLPPPVLEKVVPPVAPPIPPGPGPSPDFGDARRFGNDRNRISTLPTGVTDQRAGTFSCWFKMADIVTQQTTLMWVDQAGGGSFGGLIRHQDISGMKVILNLFTTQPASQTGLTLSNSGGMSLNTWHHFMASWDNAFPVDAANNLTVYFDGALSTDGVGGAQITQANSDFPLDWLTKGNAWTQGSKAANFDGGGFGGPLFLNACLANFYLNIDERIDLTVLANREKFRTGAAGQATGVMVDLGADGSLPSGSQPAFYAANGDLVDNQGYSDDLPLNSGTVVDCVDAPPTS